MTRYIGRYKILDTLGQGAMATVYKAHDPSIGRTLAIKVLRAERCVDKEYRTRFLREARAVGTLSHPNIVTIFDTGEIENSPYMVMELLDGKPLDIVIKEQKRLELTTVLKIGHQLALALDLAHDKGIIHRDVKPSNILILNDGVTIKLTDFGIARMETAGMTQQTQVGEVLGTPQYMSPEQVLGKRVDARSDLFSVGVLLYQLLTGEKPFQANTLATLLHQIATKNPIPINKLAPELPSTLKQTVEKLLNKQPERRFQSGKALARSLQTLLDDINNDNDILDKSITITMPLRIKWILTMTMVVAFTMLLCGSFLYKAQQKTIINQAFNYGGSLVKFIAVESAESVLSEDWASVERFVQNTVERQNFSYLTVIDHNNIIRGSTEVRLIGQTYKKLTDAVLIETRPELTITAHTIQHISVLDFSTPIVYQRTKIGRLYLGLPRAPLEKSANQMILLLGILIGATLIAVIMVTLMLGRFAPLSKKKRTQTRKKSHVA